MEGKLIKTEVNYLLENQEGVIISSTSLKKEGLELSLKNCQEIEQQLPNQTEWDVEVEMICPHPQDTYVCGIQYGCDEDGCNHPNQVPYLDSDGCLILKRI